MLFFITTSLGAKSAPRLTLFNNRAPRLQRYEGLRQPVAKMLRHSHEKTTCLASNRCQSQVCEIKYFPLPPFKVVPPSFEHGLVLLATLKRGGGGVKSTRSWTGHLSQNTVQCLKYFCNWLQHNVQKPKRKTSALKTETMAAESRFASLSCFVAIFLTNQMDFAKTMIYTTCTIPLALLWPHWCLRNYY